MFRIVHLSDIHFSQDRFVEYANHVFPSIIKDLTEFNKDYPISLIAITGDLLDKAGQDFTKGILSGYDSFETEFLGKLVETLKLDRSQVVLCPGNHDIDKKLDSQIDEFGLQHLLISAEEVNNYISKNDRQGMKRLGPFLEYRHKYFGEIDDSLDYCKVIEHEGIKIGVASLNSVWRSYDSSTDSQFCVIGERQIMNAVSKLSETRFRVVLLHNHPRQLAEFDYKICMPLLEQHFNLMLCGHVHTGEQYAKVGLIGKQFVSIASSNWSKNILSDTKRFANGYFVIDLDFTTNSLTSRARQYSFPRGYTSNPELGDESGQTKYQIPGLLEFSRMNEMLPYINRIKENFPEFANEHLLSYCSETGAPKAIKQIFVMPQLSYPKLPDVGTEEKTKETPNAAIEIETICESKSNWLIWGGKECGKTVLLDRIMLEMAENCFKYGKIAVYSDFQDSFNRCETVIYRYLGVGASEIQNVLNNNDIVWLIDNLSFDKNNVHKLRLIEEFLKLYPRVKVVATCPLLPDHRIPIEDISEYETLSTFLNIEINYFGAKQLRLLTKKWFSKHEIYDSNKKLGQLVRLLTSLNIPRTPLAISMFLLIIEQQDAYRPINQATMLENFIEKLFHKQSVDEVYSESFDYRNKERLLTEISYHMYCANNDKYRILFSDLNIFVEQYLQARRFEFKSRTILQYLLDIGIFKTVQIGASEWVEFRFNCYFQYFLMLKIQRDSSFREFVLKEENYLKFYDEIDYLTGISRDKGDILTLLINRMNIEFEPYNRVFKEHPYDKLFSLKHSVAASMDTNKIAKIKKPTEVDIEQMHDAILSAVPADESVQKKGETFTPFKKLELLWTLAAKVLKNTEEIEDPGLKRESFSSIVACSMSFSGLFYILVQ